jgi:hypothetical protein
MAEREYLGPAHGQVGRSPHLVARMNDVVPITMEVVSFSLPIGWRRLRGCPRGSLTRADYSFPVFQFTSRRCGRRTGVDNATASSIE